MASQRLRHIADPSVGSPEHAPLALHGALLAVLEAARASLEGCACNGSLDSQVCGRPAVFVHGPTGAGVCAPCAEVHVSRERLTPHTQAALVAAIAAADAERAKL